MILNILLAIKEPKKLDLYAYFFLRMSAYRRDFDKTKCMYFLIKDEKLLKKYKEIWSAASSKNNLTLNLNTIKNI